MLLDAGADPSEGVHCAIMYQALESLEILLEADLWYFRRPGTAFDIHPDSINSLIDLALWKKGFLPVYPQILSLLVNSFARARVELMELAKQYLSPSQLEDLDWSEYRNSHYKVDRAALAIYHKLQDVGVPCRKKIYPGAARTIYHGWINAEVAEGFWKAGFTEIEEYDNNGFTPLLLITHNYIVSRMGKALPLVLWFLQRGAQNLVYPESKNNTLIHKLAAAIGANINIDDTSNSFPEIIRLSMDRLSSYPEDDCVCYCSRAGCSPVTALIKHMSHRNRMWNSADGKTNTWWNIKQYFFQKWIRHCPESLCGGRAFYDLCRVELFERIGMRHTCCKFLYNEFKTVDALEAEEFREEDKHSKIKLDGLLGLYRKLEREYTGDFERFWKIWWVDLEDFVPMEVFWNDGRGTRIWPDDALPLPLESLDKALAGIREHVMRSMALSRPDVSQR
jgi:hypothetical protein